MNRKPHWTVLFSGLGMDAPLASPERFPPDMAPLASAEIALRLALLDAGPGDLALCHGGCGGDLLFAEAALARRMRLELRLPFEVERFVEAAVDFAGPAWRSRFDRVRADPRTVLYCLPRGAALPTEDPFEQADLWQLDAALSHGAERVWLMTLWDGKPRAGGGAYLTETIGRYTGQVIPIDATRLLRRTRERRRN